MFSGQRLVLSIQADIVINFLQHVYSRNKLILLYSITLHICTLFAQPPSHSTHSAPHLSSYSPLSSNSVSQTYSHNINMKKEMIQP